MKLQDPSPKPIFQGQVIALILGITNYETKKELQKKITSRAGTVSCIINKKCQFVISCKSEVDNSRVWGYKLAKKYGIPILPPDFIDACISEEGIISLRSFSQQLMSKYALEASQHFGRGEICNVVPADDFHVISKPAISTGSRMHQKVKVWNYGAPDGPQFHIYDYRVAKSILLISAYDMNGETSFCNIKIQTGQRYENEELSAEPNQHVQRYCILVHTGTTRDSPSITKKIKKSDAITCRYTNDRDEALEIYNSLCKMYTAPPYSLRKLKPTEEPPSALISLQLQENMQELWSLPPQCIDDKVNSIVSTVWADAIKNLEDNSLIKALSTVSLKDIITAESYLLQMSGFPADAEPNLPKLHKKYFDLLNYVQKADLTTRSAIVHEMQLLQSLRDVANILEAISDSDRSCQTLDVYKALRCCITHLREDSKEYLEIKDKIKTFQSKENIEIINVFKIRRLAEHLYYKDDLSNVQLLYHGCSSEYAIGVLSRGILAPRIKENEQDRTFQKEYGIHFSNSLSGMVQHSTPSHVSGTRMVFIAEVALGNCYESKNTKIYLENFNKYDSIRVPLPGDRVHSDVQEYEYEVFESCKIILKYLVEFKLDEDTNVPVVPQDEGHFKTRAQSTAVSRPLLSINNILDELNATREKQNTTWGLQSSLNISFTLKGVHIRCQLIDTIAKVVVLQEYFNDTTITTEAKYTFPLDEMAAVCDFEAFINDKHLVGEIKEKKQAHEEYREAIKMGHGGYLMDEEDQNIFAVRVGNIPPKSRVIIKITYVTELITEDKNILFALQGSFLSSTKSWSDKLQFNNSGKSVTKTIPSHHQNVSLEIGIEMPFEIRRISSPTNKILIKQTDTMATVKLANGENITNDFKLLIDLAEIHVPRMWVEKSPNEESEACMLTFYPSFETSEANDAGVVVFLLDASNSMKNRPFSFAKSITIIALRQLKPTWKFNIILFGSVYEELFPAPQENTLSNIGIAEDFLLNAEANFGCTDAIFALQQFILLPPRNSFDIQNIFIISDGNINDIELLFQSIKKLGPQTRLFTCGLDSDSTPCNQHFLKTLAKRGAGAYEFFDYNHKGMWETKMKRQVYKASQPVLSDIEVQWQQLNNDTREPIQAPRHVESLFRGSKQIIYGLEPNCNLVELKANVGGYNLSTVVSTSELSKTKGKLLHCLAARAIIRDWRDGIAHKNASKDEALKYSLNSYIIELSKTFGILSPLTSYLAIEKREDTQSQEGSDGPLINDLLQDEVVDKLFYIEYPSEQHGQSRTKSTHLQNISKNSASALQYEDFTDGYSHRRQQTAALSKKMSLDTQVDPISGTFPSGSGSLFSHRLLTTPPPPPLGQGFSKTFSEETEPEIHLRKFRQASFKCGTAAAPPQSAHLLPIPKLLEPLKPSENQNIATFGSSCVYPLSTQASPHTESFSARGLDLRNMVLTKVPLSSAQFYIPSLAKAPGDEMNSTLEKGKSPLLPSLYCSDGMDTLSKLSDLQGICSTDELEELCNKMFNSSSRSLTVCQSSPIVYRKRLTVKFGTIVKNRKRSLTSNTIVEEQPISSLIVKVIQNDHFTFVPTKVKLLLTKGPGPREQDLKAALPHYTPGNTCSSSFLPDSSKTPFNVAMWQHQAEEGHFLFSYLNQWTDPDLSLNMVKILEDAGLQSLGGIKHEILNMCATLVALLHAFKTIWEEPASKYKDKTKDVLQLMKQLEPQLVLKILKALLFINWVQVRHPLLFTNLSLEKYLENVHTWESFVEHFVSEYPTLNSITPTTS